ncbi:SDR family oxidoreductase, partial [Methylobacterium radiotolerans]
MKNLDELIADSGRRRVRQHAGAGLQTPFLDVTLEEWNRVLDTDLTGAFVCLQRAARAMVTAG